MEDTNPNQKKVSIYNILYKGNHPTKHRDKTPEQFTF